MASTSTRSAASALPARIARALATPKRSSRRSRRAGRWMRAIASRANRSRRNAPRSTMASRSRLVAATTSTSTRTARCAPTGSTSRFSSRRSSLAWRVTSSSPISSRKSVPPSCAATIPSAALFASENAPATWPNICDSKTPRATPAMFTAPKGAALPSATAAACASSSLPAPVSPSTSTLPGRLRGRPERSLATSRNPYGPPRPPTGGAGSSGPASASR